MKLNLRELLSRLRSPDPSPAATAADPASPAIDLQALLMVSQTMSSLRDLDQVLNFLLGEIQKILRVDCGVLMTEQEQIMRVRSHRGFSAGVVSSLRFPAGEGLLSDLTADGKAVLSEDQSRRLAQTFPELAAQEWRSILAAPLRVQNQEIGIFLAGSTNRNFFGEGRIEAVDPLLQILSVAIRNTQLFERMEKFNRRLEAEVAATTQELIRTNNRLIHRVRELKALYEITSSASTSGSLEEMLATVAARIQDLFNTEAVGFFIAAHKDTGPGALVLEHPSFGLPRPSGASLRLDPAQQSECGPAVRAVLEAYSTDQIRVFRGETTMLSKELPWSVSAASLQQFEKVLFRSLAAVPLKTSHRSLGVMVLTNCFREQAGETPARRSADLLTEEELRTLALIAARVAASIESLRLNAEVQKRLADLSALQEISTAFYATPVLEFVLGKIVKIVLRTLPCDLCTFMFFDPSAEELIQKSEGDSSGGLRVSLRAPDISSEVFREGKTKILDSVESGKLTPSPLEIRHNIRSMMFVPLKVENEVIGLLRLGSCEKAYFSQRHLKITELIADRAAVIVQNARLYDRLVKANHELERLNQVKTEFVSMVSHELRTPVTAIKGFVDVVMNGEAGPLNDQQTRFLRIAHNSIDRLTLLISDLLDLSRIESGQLKLELTPITLTKVLQDSAETYRSTIESKGIAFAVEIAKKLPEVLGDESRVKQVIDNLLSNAMKFTPSGGKVRLVADDMGDFVLVSVSDTGVGVAKENHEKIFEKFFQVDSSLTRQVGGTGLGLAISKSIIEMHGGRIWVESESGKGATFRFLLPRLREKKAAEKGAG